jgi:hypothetical protein
MRQKMKKVILTQNSVSNYQREIAILKNRIKGEGDVLQHGKKLSDWLAQYIEELNYAKYLKKQGKFN